MNRCAISPAASGPALAKAILRISLLALLVAVILPGIRLHAESANSDYKHGQDAEAREDFDTAFLDYEKAFQRDPKDLRYRESLDRVRLSASAMHVTKGRKLLLLGQTQAALAEFLHANEIDPGNEAAQQEIAKVRQTEGVTVPPSDAGLPETATEQREIASMGSPVQLKPLSNEPLTLHMTEDTKVIYQAIGKAAGINVLFDPDYNSKRIQVDLSNVSLLDALRIVGTMSSTFWRPVTSNTIFVAQDTRIKRTELDEQAVQTFYLTNAWQQNDLNDIQTALRNVLGSNVKVYGVASQNAIVMRGTPDELLLASKLINDLDKPRSEVVVDIAVLEVSKDWERTLGIAWPSSIGAALQAPNSSSSSSSTTSTTSTTTSSTSPSLYDLAHLKASDFAVTVGSATLNLLLNDDNTQILQDPRIRATDGQKATLTIGSKIPIATGSYSAPGLTATAAIGYAQTQFQYQDVGVKVEVTPTVHYDDDVTLKIHIEVSSQSGNVTIEGVTEPILSQRVADQVIRLREGEASILGGILNNQEQDNWTGIPGLSSIPILKYLFGSKDHTINNDEIVFAVVPHVVRGPELDQENLRAIDTGEGQSIELRHVQPPAPTIQPIVFKNSTVGEVPAQAAPAAAREALQQMSAHAQTVEMPAPHPAAQAAPAPPPATLPPPAAAAPPAAQAAAPGSMSFVFQAPAAPQAVGATFQVPIVLDGGTDISSVPLQFHYDASRLSLINVASGNLLNRDGQAVALIHRDDGPGNVTVVASRPPGATGISGSGQVCVLTFQAKAPGASQLIMTRAGAVNSKQQSLPAQSAQASITVR